ncbi:Podospora anserina S mat+ genomic DNA chromosome 2, supercontig 2 [Echinococcus multilocularis]|uniref:Podospora anserina S mat+ genomic DNA chromosome 2, supercontig 2 n=1 Tax=Echinococcus multilocularis TaxID=6211 RepID=A0A0S4MIK4_ECHMU|nr:Podospora anserina S mat+ genomic DNA chromosome 2, supercontig 2 [Echinococcus multilocularis]
MSNLQRIKHIGIVPNGKEFEVTGLNKEVDAKLLKALGVERCKVAGVFYIPIRQCAAVSSTPGITIGVMRVGSADPLETATFKVTVVIHVTVTIVDVERMEREKMRTRRVRRKFGRGVITDEGGSGF